MKRGEDSVIYSFLNYYHLNFIIIQQGLLVVKWFGLLVILFFWKKVFASNPSQLYIDFTFSPCSFIDSVCLLSTPTPETLVDFLVILILEFVQHFFFFVFCTAILLQSHQVTTLPFLPWTLCKHYKRIPGLLLVFIDTHNTFQQLVRLQEYLI